MEFKVRVSELRYGDAVVEAGSEDEAKTLATGAKIDFFDSEITDMTVEPLRKDGYSRELLSEPFIWEPEDWTPEEWDTLCKICGLPPDNTERIVLRASEVEYFLNLRQKLPHAGRTYLVTEVCPHCESEVEMRWNTDTLGYKAFCPVCGKRLMLCDECHQLGGGCDYDSKTDSCRLNPATAKANEIPPALRVETPLGALIVRAQGDPDHPGIFVDLRRQDADQDLLLTLVEFCEDEGDLPDGKHCIITRVWDEAMQDEYAYRHVHKGIDEFFVIEEGENDRPKEPSPGDYRPTAL